MFKFTSLLVLLPAMLRFAAAGHPCTTQLPGTPGNTTEADPSLCLGQGEGSYTFAMWYTNSQDAYFYIMDNACNILATYDVPITCPTPFVIEENFLKYVLTIEQRWYLGDPSSPGDFGFEFKYANGDYKIGENQCSCQSSRSVSLPSRNNPSRPGGGNAEQSSVGCKCAFPVDGEPSKRSISFNA